MATPKEGRHKKKPAVRATKKAKPPSKEIGKFVVCFQMVGKHTTPFEAELIGERGNGYWLVKDVHTEEYQVNKGSCSTVPFRKKEIGTAAYREKVLAQAGSPVGQGRPPPSKRRPADVCKPKGDSTVSTGKASSPGRKRSGNGKDKKSTGSVGNQKKKGWGRITSNSP